MSVGRTDIYFPRVGIGFEMHALDLRSTFMFFSPRDFEFDVCEVSSINAM